MAQPRVSVVMPTRNRAHFLARAVASVQAQTWTDLEIIVSDNASTDATGRLAQTLAAEDARIRYVRRPTAGTMVESWSFALAHAQGELITFLSDDDAFAPTALATAVAAMDDLHVPLAVWRYAFYYHSTWSELSRRNHLLLQPFTGQVQGPPVAATLAKVFDRLEMVDWPQFSNALMHRNVWARMLEMLGDPFPCAAGDCYTGLGLLLAAQRYAVIDQPLTLYGWWGGSFTASLARQSVAELAAEPLPGVPLPFPFTTNLFTSALRQAQRAVAPRADAFSVNWVRYFEKTREELRWLRSKGLAIDALEAAWQQALAQQPLQVQHHFQLAERHDGPHPAQRLAPRGWRHRLRERINASPFLFHWETQLRPRLRLERALLLDGRRLGFADILGAARTLPRLIARGFSRAHRRGRACTGVVI